MLSLNFILAVFASILHLNGLLLLVTFATVFLMWLNLLIETTSIWFRHIHNVNLLSSMLGFGTGEPGSPGCSHHNESIIHHQEFDTENYVFFVFEETVHKLCFDVPRHSTYI